MYSYSPLCCLFFERDHPVEIPFIYLLSYLLIGFFLLPGPTRCSNARLIFPSFLVTRLFFFFFFFLTEKDPYGAYDAAKRSLSTTSNLLPVLFSDR